MKGARTHRKVLRDNIQGISKPALRRLARRGGVQRMGGLLYEEEGGILHVFLEDHLSGKVTTMDVVHALHRQGTLFGFGG